MKNILAIIGVVVIMEKIFEAGRLYENGKQALVKKEQVNNQ